MKLCRFRSDHADVRIGLVTDDSSVFDLTPAGITSISRLLEEESPFEKVQPASTQALPRISFSQIQLLSPVEQQEVWAAGVTYLRIKKARMEESNFSATAYDRVYEAPRPELFFKSLPQKVAGPDTPVGIRKDAHWSVPEPELALVLNSKGAIAGFTVGNDMSSRDIEGENLLYLPQAKIYRRSCSVGPWIVIGRTEEEARRWIIGVEILRQGEKAFSGETSVGQIKRSFDELAECLFRSQSFPNGAVLLTGTGVVPPDTFTLQTGDEIHVHVSGIGTLRNTVIDV